MEIYKLPSVNETLSVSQHLAKVILELHKVGTSPEIISSSLGLTLHQVLGVLGADKSKGQGLVESFSQRSSRFRCSFSGRLMASPVLAPDKRLYDQSSLKSSNLDFFGERAIKVPYLKDEIQLFYKASLQQLEFSSEVSEDALTIAAECLSVLNVHTELDSFLRVLAPLSKYNLELALTKLRRDIPEVGLLSLLTQLADLEDYKLISLLLVQELVKQPLLHFEDVFDCFLKVLSQNGLPSESLDLVEQLISRLNNEQIIKIIEALSLHERDQHTQQKIDELKLVTRTQIGELTLLILHELSNTYSYSCNTGDLYITDLRTGENTLRTIPSYRFNKGCSWCSISRSFLCFTGGQNPYPCTEAVTIEVAICNVLNQAPMLTARYNHGSVQNGDSVFVLGGSDGMKAIKECERYSLSEDRWEALPPLPTAVQSCGVVTQETTQSLYVLGGLHCDLIQELNLVLLEWRTLSLNLPSLDSIALAVFKVSEQEILFVHSSILYAFIPSVSRLNIVKHLSAHIQSHCGQTYYSNGTLYCSSGDGAGRELVIGEIS